MENFRVTKFECLCKLTRASCEISCGPGSEVSFTACSQYFIQTIHCLLNMYLLFYANNSVKTTLNLIINLVIHSLTNGIILLLCAQLLCPGFLTDEQTIRSLKFKMF